MTVDFLFSKPLNRWIAIQGDKEKIKSIKFLPPHHRKRESLTLEISFELALYFQGEKTELDYRADLSHLTPFQQKILETARQIKYGETTSYTGLAALAGTKAVRSVGTALSRNPVPLLIPCHRILAKKGLGGYSAGVEIKKRLLELEGRNLSI